MSKDNKNNSGDGNSGYWNSGDGNSGYWNSGYRNSGYWNSGYGNTGYWNSGDRNSGYGNSGYWNSGYGNSGDGNSGYWNSGDRNSGDGNSGYRNSGYGNSCSRSSGIFCNKSPQVICFNLPTDKPWEEIDHPDFSEFALCEWVDEGKMTDQEKIDNTHWFTTQGYLKTITDKEAWANFWGKTSEENKAKFLRLPNFDAEIFKDITGIDVDVKPEPLTLEQRIERLEKLQGGELP